MGILKILRDKGVDTHGWEDCGKHFAELFIAAKPDHYRELLDKMNETYSKSQLDESEAVAYICR